MNSNTITVQAWGPIIGTQIRVKSTSAPRRRSREHHKKQKNPAIGWWVQRLRVPDAGPGKLPPNRHL